MAPAGDLRECVNIGERYPKSFGRGTGSVPNVPVFRSRQTLAKKPKEVDGSLGISFGTQGLLLIV